MKKITLLVTAISLSGFFFNAMAAGTGNRAQDKELRQERRELRREEALHSVNSQTAARFQADFPEATNVYWTQGNFAEASFTDAGIEKTAYYDQDNDWIGTTSKVSTSALPAKALSHIARYYPGYAIDEVMLFDDNESNSTDLRLFPDYPAPSDNYFALLKKDGKKIVVEVSLDGEVSYFTREK